MNALLKQDIPTPVPLPGTPEAREAFRVAVFEAQATLATLPPVECPLNHHFAPGAYAREILLPAGSMVIGKIHKHAHINVISQGKVSVLTEAGKVDMQAPYTFVSEPGTKRVVFAWEDTVWTTIHVTKETDLEKIEDEVIAPSYEALAAFQTKALEVLP